jgi:hypothetical protein
MRLRVSALLAVLLVASASPARAQEELKWDGSEPPTGIYFKWYEPSFYTGFAPRTQDPSRVHLELGRGSQTRVTVVLGEAELDHYLGDLEARRALYQELVDRKIIELTTNVEYEKFVKKLEEQRVAAHVAARSSMNAQEYRSKALEVMSALNPDRVFRIRIPMAKVAAQWHAALAKGVGSTTGLKLDAANAALPERLNLNELTPAVDAALAKAAAVAASSAADSQPFRAETASFITTTSGGRYRASSDAVEAIEFTAIYPSGTADQLMTFEGNKIPDVGVTGVWPLIRRENGRGQLGMVDYLSTNPGYGFIPILGYQYAGGIAYNAFHNAGVRAQLNSTPFLPKEWRNVTSERDGKPMQNLWIVGRGPTSHGCTRLPSGHMSELRQIVPSENDAMVKVKNFRNKSECYDVFDLRGDGDSRVMGVQYYLAYKSHKHLPTRVYAPNKRDPFYRFLYGSNIEMGPIGSARIKDVPVCRFVGLRKAEVSSRLKDVPLHEAAYEPEKIQFYKIKPASFESGPGFHFNREIRKVGAGHTVDRKLLFLD